jgi:SNF2 family DNA or RNA helicase
LVSATAQLTNDGQYKKFIKDENRIQCTQSFIEKSIKLQNPNVREHRCFNDQLDIIHKVFSFDQKLTFQLNALEFNALNLKYYPHVITSSMDLLKSMFLDTSYEIKSVLESLNYYSKVSIHPNMEKKLREGIDELAVERFGKKFNFDKIQGLNDKQTRYNELEKILKLLSNTCFNKYCLLCGDSISDCCNKVKTTCCSFPSMYHSTCIEKWDEYIKKEKACPICWKELRYESNTETTLYKKSSYNGKMDELIEVINLEKNKPHWKMLLFSDYVGTFNQIKTLFDKQKIEYCELEGNQLTISKALDDFKNTDGKNILLIHSQHYGGGLNLEFSTSVVLFHKTIRNEQLIGRAQRYGRKTQLSIHHLLYLWEK